MQESFELEDFTRVSANGIQQIFVTQGPEFSVTLEGTQRAQVTHKPIVENGIVSLQTLPDNNDRCVIFCLSRKSTLHVTMPSLDSAVAEDGSYIRLESFSGSSMTITTQDIAYVEADVSLSAIAVNTQDNSSVDLRGSANTITAITKDISHIRGEHFTVQDATIMLADVSRMEYISTPITVEVETLDVASVQQRGYE